MLFWKFRKIFENTKVAINVCYIKNLFYFFCKIHREKPMLEPLSNKVLYCRPAILLKVHYNADLKICQYLLLHIKIICWRIHINTLFTFWDMHRWDMWKVCLKTFRNKLICQKLSFFLRNLQTREFLGSRMRNFQGIDFIWTQTYREIFKSALVYLQKRDSRISNFFWILRMFSENTRSSASKLYT